MKDPHPDEDETLDTQGYVSMKNYPYIPEHIAKHNMETIDNYDGEF